jgi:hypothetical protein
VSCSVRNCQYQRSVAIRPELFTYQRARSPAAIDERHPDPSWPVCVTGTRGLCFGSRPFDYSAAQLDSTGSPENKRPCIGSGDNVDQAEVVAVLIRDDGREAEMMNGTRSMMKHGG